MAFALSALLAGEPQPERDQRLLVGKNQTISVPARTPHAFTVVSPEGARFIAFLPKQGAHMATKYLEGGPPLGADQK